MSFSFPVQVLLFFAVALGLGIAVRVVAAETTRRRFARAGLAEVNRMHWREFEKYLQHLFATLGYHAELTPPSGDNGVDVILTDGNGVRTAVQAKRWRKGNLVGSPEVQRTVGGAQYYHCQRVLVVTTSGYTQEAKAFARQTGTELWGPDELADAIEQARSRQGQAPVAACSTAARHAVPRPAAAGPGPMRSAPVAQPRPAPAPQSAPVKAPATAGPACPKCGAPMTARRVNDQAIWLCSRFPQCNGSKLK